MKALASLRLTGVALVLLAAGVLWAYFDRAQSVPALVAPMALLAMNLGCAILVNPKFRSQPPLLVFHVALLVLVLLAAAGRLTFLDGRVELSTGEAFTGELLDARHGPLHRSRLAQAAFVNEGFEIDYAPKWKRLETRNLVRWRSARGEETGIIGDQTPLVLEGYRFYTTSNKGFAPVFTWQGAGAPAQRGAVHLPPYPVLQFAQQARWTLPGTERSVTVRLPLDEELIDYERTSRFRLPPSHNVEVIHGGKTQTLRPGASLDLEGGRLRYEGLTTWMGYVVFFDWTLPWLAAAGAAAALALGWHFWRRFAARPWNEAR
ncbi:MAG TPA: cytochrome c biogenesis protein ResB [Burkholderiales bacterium]|nr:cytochrome c biogenesis protein ResB [Burkholderiales bacterium]